MKHQNRNGNDDSNSNSNSNPPSTLSLHLSDDNNLSQLEIVKASQSAAEVAAKIAIAARAVAEKKAVIAAMAMAAAKKALELVATLDEQDTSSSTPKKNKRKKHVAVQMLYDNKNPENEKTSDEELARQLHHVINRSPRIPKKLKTLISSENGGINNDKEKIPSGINKRMKQKKLPLSICHDRVQLSPNEEHKDRNSLWKCHAKSWLFGGSK
ncbi:hypothetical protein L1887_13778 [Cichorium endivia]|nr:hypothetical protein L1887_13778 [Cichorium endivia]